LNSSSITTPESRVSVFPFTQATPASTSQKTPRLVASGRKRKRRIHPNPEVDSEHQLQIDEQEEEEEEEQGYCSQLDEQERMTVYTNASTAENNNTNYIATVTTNSSYINTTSSTNTRDTSENICQANIQSVYPVPKAIKKQQQALDKSKPNLSRMTTSSSNHISLILNLRVLIKNAISQHHLKSASFYADKLVRICICMYYIIH
jgi:hypothetical protein